MHFEGSSAVLYNDPNPFSIVEWAGRTCYKSQRGDTPESAVEFFKKLAARKHVSVMEHACFVFDMAPLGRGMDASTVSRLGTMLNYFNFTAARLPYGQGTRFRFLLSTNLRALVEAQIEYNIKSSGQYGTPTDTEMWEGLSMLLCVLMDEYGPEIVYDKSILEDEHFQKFRERDYARYFKPLIALLKELPEDYTEEEMLNHQYIHMKVKCSIGVGREFLRHRPTSNLQESTRYCNYSKDKFGNEFTCTYPVYWAALSESAREIMTEAWQGCEEAYMKLINEEKVPPQFARDVIPLILNSEIATTQSAGQMKHFFDLRLRKMAGEPHPDMLMLADRMHHVIDFMKLKYPI